MLLTGTPWPNEEITAMTKPKFGPGDTITNGQTWLTVSHTTRGGYAFISDDHDRDSFFYMPCKLVDRLWSLATYEGEIIDD